MFLVGLTGGIATGKSTVSAMFKDHGINVIDADIIAREIVNPGKRAYNLIKINFGSSVIQSNGEIDRKKLGEIIFNDESKKKLLNKITHPEVYKEIFWQCLRLFLTGTHFVIIDLPLLYESGYMTRFLHKIIVVKCDKEQQLKRLMQRNNYSLEEAQSRINSQMSIDDKCKLSDYVIDNCDSIRLTRHQVDDVVVKLKSSKAYWKLRIVFGLCLFGILIILFFLIYSIFRIFY